MSTAHCQSMSSLSLIFPWGSVPRPARVPVPEGGTLIAGAPDGLLAYQFAAHGWLPGAALTAHPGAARALNALGWPADVQAFGDVQLVAVAPDGQMADLPVPAIDAVARTVTVDDLSVEWTRYVSRTKTTSTTLALARECIAILPMALSMVDPAATRLPLLTMRGWVDAYWAAHEHNFEVAAAVAGILGDVIAELRRQAALQFAYCEPVAAGALAPWHVRRLDGDTIRPGRGITGRALCGRDLTGGWDIPDAPVTLETIGTQVCHLCATEWFATGVTP